MIYPRAMSALCCQEGNGRGRERVGCLAGHGAAWSIRSDGKLSNVSLKLPLRQLAARDETVAVRTSCMREPARHRLFRSYAVQSNNHCSSMNRTHLHVSSIKLNPTYDATDEPVPQLYELIVLFREDGPPYRIWGVHVPDVLRAVLERETVRVVVMETLESQSLASRLLPHFPTHLVLAFITEPGERHCALPPTLARMRCVVLAVGLAAVFVGVLALTSSAFPAWIGAAACVVGSHRVRTALRIPTTPPSRTVTSARTPGLERLPA